MDVTALASVATSLAHARTVDTVSTAVLRKALDLQAAGAAQLLQAATQSLQANNPPHLGNRVDTVA